MFKWIYTLPLLAMLLACSGGSEVNFQSLDIQYEGEVAIYLSNNEPFTGIALETYSNLVHKHHIENGWEQKEEAFYTTGEKERVFNMKDGIRHGTSTMWYKDGTVQLEETYIEGQLNGSVKRYSPYGDLLDEKQFEMGVLVVDENE